MDWQRGFRALRAGPAESASSSVAAPFQRDPGVGSRPYSSLEQPSTLRAGRVLTARPLAAFDFGLADPVSIRAPPLPAAINMQPCTIRWFHMCRVSRPVLAGPVSSYRCGQFWRTGTSSDSNWTEGRSAIPRTPRITNRLVGLHQVIALRDAEFVVVPHGCGRDADVGTVGSPCPLAGIRDFVAPRRLRQAVRWLPK